MQPKSAAQFFIPPGVKFWAGENWRDGDDQEDTVVIRIGAMFDLREARGNGTEGYMKCGGGGGALGGMMITMLTAGPLA